MTTGERIKEARKNAGLTQRALAEKLSMATITIRQYESDKRQPGIDTIKRIATALDLAWPDLIESSEEDGVVRQERLDRESLARVWLWSALSHIYGKVEEKTYCDERSFFSYYLIAGGTEEEFILSESGFVAIIESTEDFIPALVDRLKDKRKEDEIIQEHLHRYEQHRKHFEEKKSGLYFSEDIQKDEKTN